MEKKLQNYFLYQIIQNNLYGTIHKLKTEDDRGIQEEGTQLLRK